MASDSPLTPYERKLCIVLAVLWGGFAVCVFLSQDSTLMLVGLLLEWPHGQVRQLLAGNLPEFSHHNLHAFLATSTFLGAVLLGPLYFAYLVKLGRWLRLGTLWFWTMIHWTLPVVAVLSYWGGVVIKNDPDLRSHDATQDVAATLVVLAVSLPLAFASLRAWRRRRWEKDVDEE